MLVGTIRIIQYYRLMAGKIAETWWRRKAPISIAGVLLLALIGGAISDVLVNPSLSWVGRAILELATFGSSVIKDEIYASAALNPTPLSSIILLVLVSGSVTGAVFGIIRRRKLVTEEVPSQEIESSGPRFLMHIGRIVGALIFWAMPLFLTILVMLHNQSVAIWRVFHANHRIVAPYVTEHEANLLTSRFARVTSKADFQSIADDMERIATKNGLSLRPEMTW